MAILFPLPYDGSATHAASWKAGDEFKGKSVKVVTAKGETICGTVERVEVSSVEGRSKYGVGFMLRCGSERFPYSVPVSADLQSIELAA